MRHSDLHPADEYRARKAAVVKRLVRKGVALEDAQTWIDYWDESTSMLRDFRQAPDYWDLGYEFALTEWMSGQVPHADQE